MSMTDSSPSCMDFPYGAFVAGLKLLDDVVTSPGDSVDAPSLSSSLPSRLQPTRSPHSQLWLGWNTMPVTVAYRIDGDSNEDNGRSSLRPERRVRNLVDLDVLKHSFKPRTI